MKLDIYQIDAFTNRIFGGNPACVIPLKEWLADAILLQIAKENAGGLLDKMDKTGTASKILKGGLGSVLTTSRLLELAVLGVFKAMVSIDKLNGELAKGLNMSYSNAAALSSELSTAANMSGAVKLTAEGLGKSTIHLPAIVWTPHSRAT